MSTAPARAGGRLRALLLALALALGLGATPSRADLASGLAALERSDYATARHELAPLADQGDHDAQYAMGRMLLYGWGAPRDPQAAARWFTAAAEGGHERSRRMLAALYEQGTGVPKDPAAARKWRCLADLAARGPRESAPRFTRDWACEAPDAAALERMRTAAAAGDAAAQNELGTALAQGAGTAADAAQALTWFREAAKQGSVQAMHNLGAMHELGLGLAPDYSGARSWYAKAGLPESLRSIHRIDLLTGWHGIAWGTVLGPASGFTQTERTPVLLEQMMRLQRYLTGRQQYAFFERRGEPKSLDGVPVDRIVYQAGARDRSLCAVWIDFGRRSNYESLLRSLSARHGPPHASSSMPDEWASVHVWDFRGGVRVLLDHFKPGAADESMGILAIVRSDC